MAGWMHRYYWNQRRRSRYVVMVLSVPTHVCVSYRHMFSSLVSLFMWPCQSDHKERERETLTDLSMFDLFRQHYFPTFDDFLTWCSHRFNRLDVFSIGSHRNMFNYLYSLNHHIDVLGHKEVRVDWCVRCSRGHTQHTVHLIVSVVFGTMQTQQNKWKSEWTLRTYKSNTKVSRIVPKSVSINSIEHLHGVVNNQHRDRLDGPRQHYIS